MIRTSGLPDWGNDSVMGPLLDLGQDWQRQRAQLRAAHRRPPPFVTAGLDLVYDAQAPLGRRVQVQGMALVFGIFPASLAEFLDLARSRLRLGGDQARQELASVLSARIQSLWAWLPGLQCDIYAEVDHATAVVQLWQIGPGAGVLSSLDPATAAARLDDAFLEGLVLNGTRHWGGASGLARLIRRFGRRPLLVAAQVADLLERTDIDLDTILEVARSRWGTLDSGDEEPWDQLAETEHPWVCAQLGRLALRLGVFRPAWRLLGRVAHAQAGPAVWGDYGRACDEVGDWAGAEVACAQVANLAPDEGSLTRLIVARVRLGQYTEATEALTRLRALGAADVGVVDAVVTLLERPGLPLVQRAHSAGWLAARTPVAFAARWSVDDLIERFETENPYAADGGLRDDLAIARLGLIQALGSGSDETAELALRVVLLAMPFTAASATRQVGDCAAHALLSLRIWADLSLGAGRIPDTVPVRQSLLALARRALA